MLYDDDPDVRLAAALTLGAKKGELRLAAIASAWRGLSMAETLANRRRARSKPPSSPRLDEMSAGALVERFVDAGERKALADRFLEWGTVKADGRTCDRLIDEINEVHDRLKARGWLERLKPLMDHGNPRVRLSAALKCLGLDETKAVVTLENLQKTGGFREKDEARLNLSLWRKSRSREGADSVSGGPTQSSVN